MKVRHILLPMLLSACLTAHAEMPWSVRVDAVAGSSVASPLVERFCVPGTESSSPIVNAMNAESALLQVNETLGLAFAVTPSQQMGAQAWATFVGNASLARDMAAEYAATVASKPAATLKAFVEQCGSAADTVCQGNLATCQQNLTSTKAALATAQAATAKAQADLTSAKADLATAQAASTKAQSELAAANTTIASLQAQVAAVEEKRAALAGLIKRAIAARSELESVYDDMSAEVAR